MIEFGKPSKNCIYGLLIGAFAAVGAAIAFATTGTVTGHFLLAVVISIVMWQACDPFADAAQWIGVRLRIPGSVRGATLDAIASSMPELSVGILFVYELDDFGSTVATCAGSAVYNMILIPALCGLAISFARKDQPYIRVDREVMTRDGIWFLISEFFLIGSLLLGVIEWWTAVIFILLYAGYLFHLWWSFKKHRRNSKNLADEADEDDESEHRTVRILGGLARIKLNIPIAIVTILLTTAIVAFASHYLVGSCEALSKTLQVPSFFIAVIVVAAASSMPDTMLSLGAAARGDDSGAVSNAFGSNTFDVNICLSVPVLVYVMQHGGNGIRLGDDRSGVISLGVLLLVLSMLTYAIIWHKLRIGRSRAFVLISLYLIFISYAVLGSLGYVSGVI